MEGMMEPPPPGIVPNFPPHYPFKWQQKIMPEPHPNHLRSMGLPATFSTPRRSNPGYGGYQYCRGYEEGQGNGGHNNGYQGNYNGEGYAEEEEEYQRHMQEYGYGDDHHQHPSDEYGAYDDDDEAWNEDEDQEYDSYQGEQSNGYDPNLAPIFGAPAPAPRSKDHYYNLAPKAQFGGAGNGSGNYAADAPPPRAKKQQPSEGKKNHLRKVYGERYCEGCNYGFHSLEEFQEHLESHVRCPFPGCGLETTIERLGEHLTVAHILNPEESKPINTEEYLRQRKNSFPSVQRAQLKAALAEQQKKRGEILAMDHKWEKKRVGKKEDYSEENNDVVTDANLDDATLANKTSADATTSDANPTPEVDSCHVDSHEYEPVGMTQDRKQDGNAKRKLMEGSRQRLMAKRRKVAFHRKREMMVEREVDVLGRIPAFCGIEEYREDPQDAVIASTLSHNDASQCEPSVVFHISDDEDDIPSAHISSSPLKNNVSVSAQSLCNNSDNCVTNSEINSKATNIPSVTSNALGLLLGDYGSDSEDEESEVTGAPTLLNGTNSSAPVVNTIQETVSDLHVDSPSMEKIANAHDTSSVEKNGISTSGSSIHSSDAGEVKGREAPSCDVLSTEKNVALEVNSESEEEVAEAKISGGAEGSKKRRRGKRGKKKRRCPVSDADSNLGANTSNCNYSGLDEVSKDNEHSKTNSEGTSSTCSRSKVVVPSIAPHLKPLNKKEEELEECEESNARERLPTTRWTEDKIFSYQLKGQYKKFKNNYKQSLLVKLLGDEVVRERNIILQCAKYIVQNDFFEQNILPSRPRPNRVLVEERTVCGVETNTPLQNDREIVISDNNIRQGKPDTESVNEDEVRQGKLDTESVMVDKIRQGEPDSKGLEDKTVARRESIGEAVNGNVNGHGEVDSEGALENIVWQGENDKGASTHDSNQAAPILCTDMIL